MFACLSLFALPAPALMVRKEARAREGARTPVRTTDVSTSPFPPIAQFLFGKRLRERFPVQA